MAPGEWDWLVAILIAPIQTAILGQVDRWFTQPLDRMLDPLRRIPDRMVDLRASLATIPGQILAALVAPLATIGSRIADNPDRLVHGLTGPIGTIAHHIASNPDRLVQGLTAPIGTLIHHVASNPDRLVQGLTAPIGTLTHHIASNPGQIVAGLMSPLAGLEHYTATLATATIPGLSQPLWEILAQVGIGTHGLQVLPSTLGTVGMSLLSADQAERRALTDQYWQKLLALGPDLQGRIQVAGSGSVPGFLRGLEQYVTGSLANAYGLVQGYVLGQGPITPEMANTVGMRAFLAASGLGAAAHLVSTAVELVHPLKTMGLHYLSGFLADMGSFSSISNALVGTLAQVGIAQPMRFYINARTRSNLPTMGDLQGMHRKHSLSKGEFAKYAAYWGMSQFWIDRYIEYLPADPRLFDILRMAETGIPETSPPSEVIPRLQRMGIRAGGNPDWWLQLKFALAGYDWIDIPKLVDTVHARMTSTERNRLITTASTNFRAGYMDEAQYRVELADAGLNQAQITWKIRAEHLAALNDDIDDLVKLFTDQYLKDILTLDELRIALVNVGVTQAKSEILARRAAIRKMPKPVDDTAKIEEKATREMQVAFSRMYKEQYRADMITADDYYRALRAIGIRDDVAWATVELEVARRIGQAKKTEIRAEAQALTRTQAAQQRLYREQFRAGLVDAAAYYSNLVAAGTLPAEARATVDAEAVRRAAALAEAQASLVRAEATRTQAARERLFRDMYRAYQLTADQYELELVDLGISPARAQAIVRDELTQRLADLEAQEARDAEATLRAAQRAQANLLREKYDAGLVDADAYLAGLLQIDTDPDLAWATVELAQVQRFALLERQALTEQEKQDLALQKAQAQLYTRRYRAGEIDAREYLDALLAIGIPDPLASVTVQLELEQQQAQADAVREALVIPAIKRAWALFVKDLEARYTAGEITLDQFVDQLVFSGLDVEIAAIVAAVTQRIRKT